MKLNSAFIFLIVTACSGEISEKKIPPVILNNFKSKFKNASNIRWGKEGKLYEIEFTLYEMEKTVMYNKEGKLLEIESEIPSDSLPLLVRKSLSNQFPGYKIEQATLIESEKPVVFETELHKGKETLQIFFDSTGIILKAVKNSKE